MGILFDWFQEDGAENENLHLGDWVKAMRSTIHLDYGLAQPPRRHA